MQELWTDWEKQFQVIAQAALRSVDTDTVGEVHMSDDTQAGDMLKTGTAKHKVRDHQCGVVVAAAQIGYKDIDVWNVHIQMYEAPSLRPAELTKRTHWRGSVP